jgi:hypothetical protein
VVGAPRLHLERARDHEGSSRTAWCANFWWRECQARGWWSRELKKSNKPAKPPKMYKMAQKWQFSLIIDVKNAKNIFFYLKVLNKIFSQDVVEEYINFKIFRYLRDCGVIPVQIFVSHISLKRPS